MNLARLIDSRDAAIKILTTRFTDSVLRDVYDRSRFSTKPDGFPARTLADGGSRGTDPTTSVESAALYGQPAASSWSTWSVEQANQGATMSVAVSPDGWDGQSRFRADPVGDLIRRFVDDLLAVERLVTAMDERLKYIQGAGDSLRNACEECQGTRRCATCEGTGFHQGPPGSDGKRHSARCQRCAERAGLCRTCKGSGRKSSVENCAACGIPIPGKLHRIDGAPYHAYAGTFDGRDHGNCYLIKWREMRRTGEAPGELAGQGIDPTDENTRTAVGA